MNEVIKSSTILKIVIDNVMIWLFWGSADYFSGHGHPHLSDISFFLFYVALTATFAIILNTFWHWPRTVFAISTIICLAIGSLIFISNPWPIGDSTQFLAVVASIATSMSIAAAIMWYRMARTINLKIERHSNALAQKVAEANQRAVEANLKLVSVYEKIKWRHIDPEKRPAVLSAIANLKDKNMQIGDVYFSVKEPEVEALANEVWQAVYSGQRFNIKNRDGPPFANSMLRRTPPGGPPGEVIPVGVWILYRWGNQNSANSIASAFNSAGIVCRILDSPAVGESELRIEVGLNPSTSSEIKMTPTTQPE